MKVHPQNCVGYNFQEGTSQAMGKIFISINLDVGENVVLPTAVLTTVVLPTTFCLLPFCLLSRGNGNSDDDDNDDDGLGSPAGLG